MYAGKITISGKDGADAKPYQEKEVISCPANQLWFGKSVQKQQNPLPCPLCGIHDKSFTGHDIRQAIEAVEGNTQNE